MTLRARLVLEDCHAAHAELTNALQGSLWRRRWTAVVVLMRAVLHTLVRVDAESSPALRQALDEKWQAWKATKPEPVLLWSFIEEDRNLILKEYEHRAGQSVTVHLGAGRSQTSYHMNSGPFEGRDPRDVATEALDWLTRLVDELEAVASSDPDGD
jgi:hypothetical protein